jgi:preprotein translocase subunit SecF
VIKKVEIFTMFSYIQNRFTFYVIAGVLALASLVSFFALPLNLGIDMTGGTQTEYSYSGILSIEEVRAALHVAQEQLPNDLSAPITEIATYSISLEPKFVVQVGYHSHKSGNVADFEAKKEAINTAIATVLTSKFPSAAITQVKYVNIGEAFGKYITNTTIITLLLVVLSISLYIAYAFRGAGEGLSSGSF